jgi:SHS2 domain-containing protein
LRVGCAEFDARGTWARPGHLLHWPGASDGHATQFPHGADVGVRGTGNMRAVAFAQAAAALAASVVEPETVLPSEVVSVTYAAPDDRLLLCDWLNAVIYEMAVRRMVFSRFDVSLLLAAVRIRG